MNNIVLYSTGCPKCNVLIKKLQQKNIQYIEVTDSQVMLTKGIDAVPVLEVEGTLLDFSDAVSWINQREA